MIPVKPFPVYGARAMTFAADQTEYNPLPALIELDGRVHTRWQLSEDERRAILDGACIVLEVLTFNQPLQPLALRVEGVGEFIELAQP